MRVPTDALNRLDPSFVRAETGTLRGPRDRARLPAPTETKHATHADHAARLAAPIGSARGSQWHALGSWREGQNIGRDITDIMSGVEILKRLFARQRSDSATSESKPGPGGASVRPRLDVVVYGGSHDLEVVGESHYQDALWRVVGGRTTDRVRAEVQAALVAESDNVYDPNAISVWIDGMRVGYLSREDSEVYR
ncbi:MAG: HIRAN domain-containing protein, partial [Pseudonocardiaceae bacterium]